MESVLLYGIFNKGRFNDDESGLFDYLRNTSKPIKHTHGLSYRCPSVFHESATAEEVIQSLSKYSGEVEEHKDYIHVNTYSSNDLW